MCRVLKRGLGRGLGREVRRWLRQVRLEWERTERERRKRVWWLEARIDLEIDGVKFLAERSRMALFAFLEYSVFKKVQHCKQFYDTVLSNKLFRNDK